jgi:hypothetical protein
MEQIAVSGVYRNLLPSGGWMPNFEGTFFIDANGKVSLNHEVLNLNSTDISYWDELPLKTGITGISMMVAGESFWIIDPDAISVAMPFFKKHLSAKYKP